MNAKALAITVLALPVLAVAEDRSEVERAATERDRQSAEFANPRLRDFDTRRDAQHLPPRPDERAAQTRERQAEDLAEKPVPTVPAPDYRPLPLPGGPGHVVDPITVPGAGR